MKRQEYIELFSNADLSVLSPRQRQCVENLLSGMNMVEIAQMLGTSKQNVSQALKGAVNNIKNGKTNSYQAVKKGRTAIDYSTVEFPDYAENIRTLTTDELVAYAYRACGYTNTEVGEKIGKKEMTVATLSMKARYKLQGEEPPSKKWKRNNPEKVLEGAKQWRREHPEKCREWAERWRSENAEKDKKYKHEYYMKNRERILEDRKNYRENNKESIREYYARNKERILAQRKVYREKKKKENQEPE